MAGGPTVVVGTSIDRGSYLGSVSWVTRAAARAGIEILDRSLGGGAYTAANTDGDTISKHVDEVLAEFADNPGRLLLCGPVNDCVINLDTEPIRWAVHSADAKALAAGWQVTGQAILPFHDGPQPPHAFQTGWFPRLNSMRLSYNTWGAAHFAGRWFDPSWLLLDPSSSDGRGDRRWFRDGLHPREYGAALIGEDYPLGLLTA